MAASQTDLKYILCHFDMIDVFLRSTQKQSPRGAL